MSEVFLTSFDTPPEKKPRIEKKNDSEKFQKILNEFISYCIKFFKEAQTSVHLRIVSKFEETKFETLDSIKVALGQIIFEYSRETFLANKKFEDENQKKYYYEFFNVDACPICQQKQNNIIKHLEIHDSNEDTKKLREHNFRRCNLYESHIHSYFCKEIKYTSVEFLCEEHLTTKEISKSKTQESLFWITIGGLRGRTLQPLEDVRKILVKHMKIPESDTKIKNIDSILKILKAQKTGIKINYEAQLFDTIELEKKIVDLLRNFYE